MELSVPSFEVQTPIPKESGNKISKGYESIDFYRELVKTFIERVIILQQN